MAREKAVRMSTESCWRRARFSATIAAREEKTALTSAQSALRILIYGLLNEAGIHIVGAKTLARLFRK